MQKYNIPTIKTGDFAKLCNTNKRTLIHYDEIGLFSPAYCDDKGYRYYSEKQCDVFFTINCLKEIGMPLKEIKHYIDHKHPNALHALLSEQQKKVNETIQHVSRILQVIETKLELVETGTNLQFPDRISEVFLEQAPDEYLITSPRLTDRSRKAIFDALCLHIGYCNQHALNAGHPYGAMLSVSELDAGTTDPYTHFFTKVVTPPEGHPLMIKPAGSYAVIYLKGNYYDAEDAFTHLLEYFHSHKLKHGEYCYKEAIWDELTVENEQDYITKISVRIL